MAFFLDDVDLSASTEDRFLVTSQALLENTAYPNYARRHISAHSLASIRDVKRAGENKPGAPARFQNILGVQRRPHTADGCRRHGGHADAGTTTHNRIKSAKDRGSVVGRKGSFVTPTSPPYWRRYTVADVYGGLGDPEFPDRTVSADHWSRPAIPNSADALTGARWSDVGRGVNTWSAEDQVHCVPGMQVTSVSLRPSSRTASASTLAALTRPTTAASSAPSEAVLTRRTNGYPRAPGAGEGYKPARTRKESAAIVSSAHKCRGKLRRTPASGSHPLVSPKSLRPPSVTPRRPHSRDASSRRASTFSVGQEVALACTDLNLVFDLSNRKGHVPRRLVWTHSFVNKTGNVKLDTHACGHLRLAAASGRAVCTSMVGEVGSNQAESGGLRLSALPKRVVFAGEYTGQTTLGEVSAAIHTSDGASMLNLEPQNVEAATDLESPTALPIVDSPAMLQAGDQGIQEPVLQSGVQTGAVQQLVHDTAEQPISLPFGDHHEEGNAKERPKSAPISARETYSESLNNKAPPHWLARSRSTIHTRTVSFRHPTGASTLDDGLRADHEKREVTQPFTVEQAQKRCGLPMHIEPVRPATPSGKILLADDVLPAVGLRVDVRRVPRDKRVKSAITFHRRTLSPLKGRQATSSLGLSTVGVQNLEGADQTAVAVQGDVEATIREECGLEVAHELANVPLRLAKRAKMTFRRMSMISGSCGRLPRYNTWSALRRSTMTLSTNDTEFDSDSEADYSDSGSSFYEAQSDAGMDTRSSNVVVPTEPISTKNEEPVPQVSESQPQGPQPEKKAGGSEANLSEGRDVCDYEWIEHAIAATSAVYRPVEEYVPELFMARQKPTSARSKRVVGVVEDDGRAGAARDLDNTAGPPAKGMTLSPRKPQVKDLSSPFLAELKKKRENPSKFAKKKRMNQSRRAQQRQVSSAPVVGRRRLTWSTSARSPPARTPSARRPAVRASPLKDASTTTPIVSSLPAEVPQERLPDLENLREEQRLREAEEQRSKKERELLEKVVNAGVIPVILRVQSIWRGRKARRHFLHMRKAANLIKSFWREHTLWMPALYD